MKNDIVTTGSTDSLTTWADYHPEVARMFNQPKTPWPCEAIRTDLGAQQPTVVLSDDGELFAVAHDKIAHSADQGRTWQGLCDVPVDESVPAGMKMICWTPDGIGVTEKGTLLFYYSIHYNDKGQLNPEVKIWTDQTYHIEARIMRSSDHGQSWEGPISLDPSPFHCVGSDRARFVRLGGGVMAIALATQKQSRPGKPLEESERYFQAYIYISSDDGRTWQRSSSLGKYTCEADLLALPSGQILATARYQRVKLPSDPPELADTEYLSTEIGGHSVYKHTVLVQSDDAGKTWSQPRLVTAWYQQTACLVRLSDGTVVMPFGHKTSDEQGRRFGQRFMVSYDEGRSWSKTIYELHKGGLYASSVALPDDTIVTVHDNRKTEEGPGLAILRWQAPSREVVSKGGFFEPEEILGP